MNRIIRNPLTGSGKCLLLRTLGVVLAGALTPTLALAAEPMYTYCISHADEPECNPSAAPADTEWLHYGGDQANTRYSALNQINTSNVKNLRVAWIHSHGQPRVARNPRRWWSATRCT